DKFGLFSCDHERVSIITLSAHHVLSSDFSPSHSSANTHETVNLSFYGFYMVSCKLLVLHGAVVNVADLWKFTPLHEAAAKGKYDICKLLLQHGADPTRKNRDSNTPLDLDSPCYLHCAAPPGVELFMWIVLLHL
uniref:Uncharacterized protein n=1 Tax=Pundamilia nyererei TaxID=303518 RepID=A0A3B4HD09_9CICH